MILQLPMGRKPVDGLCEKQERALRQMRRDDPKHPLVKLLDLDPGEEFPFMSRKREAGGA